MVNLMTNRQIAQLRDGVFAVGGVVGLYVRKRYGKLRFLMRWCSKGVRRDCYLPRNLTLFFEGACFLFEGACFRNEL